jgi:DEAD/DEAH box helicase domain-containing protein
MATTARVKLNPSFWKHGFCVPFSEDVVPSSLFLKNRHYLVLDIETKQLVQDVGGWDHIDKLGISVACAYDSKSDQFLSFTEDTLKDLIKLCNERLIVGYNIRGFDLPVMVPYGLTLKGLDVFDLMYDLETLTRQRFLKLETVAQGTLGVGKSADGLQAVEWYKQGKIQQIIDYCMQDVRVTRDIFQHGRTHGYVKLHRAEGPAKEVAVNWN